MAKRKWFLLNERLREVRTALSGVREDTRLLPEMRDELTAIHDDLEGLKRTQQSRAQFATQVSAIQKDRLPEAVELTIVKRIAENARHVLLQLEYSQIRAGKPCCPICHAAKGTGHTRTCALFEVIGPPRLADSE